MRRKISLCLSIVLGMTVLAALPVAAADVKGDLYLPDGGTIPAGTTVKGDVIAGGQVEIRGIVNGDVLQTGPGNANVVGGTVKGNIEERGNGWVIVRDGATVKGNISEWGNGHIHVILGSTVKGDVSEAGGGRVLVRDDGTVVKGDVSELGTGWVRIGRGAYVNGDVCQGDPGEVRTWGPDAVRGTTDC